jgi:type VI secretion system protein ImpJ
MQSLPQSKRVIWSDGMLLQPQHFEQQESFLIHQFNERFKHFYIQTYGISRLVFDQEKLSSGLFSVAELNGLMPDGTPFDLVNIDQMPEPLSLKETDAGAIIVLAVGRQGLEYPTPEPVASLVPIRSSSSATNTHARYSVSEFAINADAELIQLASLQFRFCRAQDVSGFDFSMPIARISEITVKGEIVIDPLFSSALLDLRASEYLYSEVIGVIQLIRHRADWQMQRLNQPQTTSFLETSDFLLLQTLLRYESAIQLQIGLSPCSPLRVYEYLLALACELGAVQHPPIRISLGAQWNSLDPCASYLPILLQIKNMLARMRSRLAIEISFKLEGDGSFIAVQTLPLLSSQDRIVLAVNAQVPDEWLWERFAGQSVASSSDKLADKIRMQIPGIQLQHLTTTPAELPLQAGWHYFELAQTGQAWQELAASRNLGLHITGHWPGLTIKGWLFQARSGKLES